MPNPWPHEDTASLNAFYGNPRGSNGQASPKWEAENLVSWTPPYPMFYSDKAHSPLTHLRVHKRCLAAFDAAFKAVLQELGHDYIVAHRLDICGGITCFRTQRGGSRLSVHSWGCAIDMDPGRNPFPAHWEPGKGMIDEKFVKILQRFGFTWRGAGNDTDPMHFQLCYR